MLINKELKEYWTRNFNKLKKYKKEFGNCNVPGNYDDDKELSKWVTIQRSARQKLPKEYLVKLNKIGFDFDYKEDHWILMYNELKRFQKKYRHTFVPATFKNKELYQWLQIQRKNQSYLNKEQMEMLDILGFSFDLEFNSVYEKKAWDKNYKELVKAYKKHGDLHYNQGVFNNNASLRYWLTYQRRRYRAKRLGTEQIKQLEALGIEWNSRQDTFKRFCQRLKSFIKKNGCLPTVSTDKTLWMRINYYRGNEGRSALSPANYKILKELGVFPFKTRDERWNKNFEKLKKFKQLHGTTFVPANYKDQQLRRWVHCQKSRRYVMSEVKKNELESIGFFWIGDEKVRPTSFDNNYPILKKYFDKHGKLPSKEGNHKLYARMGYLKQESNRAKLSKEEIKKLKEIGLF